MNKCSHGEGITIKPDGIHELDPCVYVLKQHIHNVDIEVYECEKCGTIDISWNRNDDTEVIYQDDEFLARTYE